MKEDAQIVCLIKPQFEAGREQVGKKDAALADAPVDQRHGVYRGPSHVFL